MAGDAENYNPVGSSSAMGSLLNPIVHLLRDNAQPRLSKFGQDNPNIPLLGPKVCKHNDAIPNLKQAPQ